MQHRPIQRYAQALAPMSARLRRVVMRYRRTIAYNAIRGASYSAGTTAIGLIALWIRHRY